jgi:hypothetical protein
MATVRPKWMFWSTRDSIDNDVPSIMAISETIVAVILFWCISIYLHTYVLLLASVVAAPLVMLRSADSVALGLKWFQSIEPFTWHPYPTQLLNLDDLYSNMWNTIWNTALVVVSSFSGFLFAILLISGGFFDEQTRWTILVITFVIAGLAYGLTSSLLRLAMPAKYVTPPMAPNFIGAFAAVGVALAVESKGGGPVIFVAFLFMVLAFIVTRTRARTSPRFRVLLSKARDLANIIFSLPHSVLLTVLLAGGVAVIALTIRVTSCLLNIRSGIKALPQNYRKLIVCTSPIEIPELIPGARGRYTLHDVVRYKGGESWHMVPIIPFVVLVWFFPSWLYRVSLKATAWFWWPMVFLLERPKKAKEPELFLSQVLESDWQRVRRVLAWSSLAVFGGVNGLNFLYSDGLGTTFGQPVPTILVMFLLGGVNAVPWQWSGIVGSAVIIIVRYWLQHESLALRYAEERSLLGLRKRSQRRFVSIERLSRLGVMCFVIYWIGAAGHLSLLANSQRCWLELPHIVQEWAGWFYGEWAPVNTSCEIGEPSVVRNQ